MFLTMTEEARQRAERLSTSLEAALEEAGIPKEQRVGFLIAFTYGQLRQQLDEHDARELLLRLLVMNEDAMRQAVSKGGSA